MALVGFEFVVEKWLRLELQPPFTTSASGVPGAMD
jgi:hypothetical protein